MRGVGNMDELKMVSVPAYTIEEAANIFRERAEQNQLLLDIGKRMSFDHVNLVKTGKESTKEDLTKIIDELRSVARDENGPTIVGKRDSGVIPSKPKHDDAIVAQVVGYAVMKNRNGGN